MKFKGTIIITDPCYLTNGMPEDIDNKLWSESRYGEDLSVLGLSQWISDSTIYGDWSCFTYKGTKDEVIEEVNKWDQYSINFFNDYCFGNYTQEEQDKMYSEFAEKRKIFIEKFTYGQFCEGSGMVCVCYLDEINKINSKFKEWVDSHPRCVTIIEDFEGEINYKVDDHETLHIVGIGNKNFYTLQSGF